MLPRTEVAELPAIAVHGGAAVFVDGQSAFFVVSRARVSAVVVSRTTSKIPRGVDREPLTTRVGGWSPRGDRGGGIAASLVAR